jgi:spermidine synthase
VRQQYRTIAWLIAFCIGFLSLSQEILWVRVVTFVQQGVPQSFAFVLTMFLLGVAIGAALGRRACFSSARRTLSYGVVLIALAGLTDLVLPRAIGWAGATQAGAVFLAPLIILSAAIKAALFPIVHHLGSEVEGGRTGRTVSRVYFMNIAGSTLGPLLTGFVLLDYFSAQAMFQLLGIAGLCMAAVAMLWLSPRLAVAGLVVALAGGALVDRGDHSMIRALAGELPDAPIIHVVENRHGILHTVRDGEPGDVVYGGNVYDGRVNVDLVANSNRIDRMYLLAALHPAPKRVLVIGLSTGAWTKVLAAFPSVERIDVVEINPGYLSLIRKYRAVETVLSDPRIHVHIDDGRRWLRRHPEVRFDLVVMNTTFHWRAYSTNLLAIDFLQMARSHLAPGGVLAFNATGSPDAFFTATQAFPHAYRWSNFIYAAEHDFRNVSMSEARERLLALDWATLSERDEMTDNTMVAIDRMLSAPFVSIEDAVVEAGRLPETITVQNMVTEYRYGRGF